MRPRARAALALVLSGGALATLLVVLARGVGGTVPPLGPLLDPAKGALAAAGPVDGPADGALPGLAAAVTVIRDERGVPHIFAESDADAVRALGYVVAEDRGFQLDFVPRVGAGRLAEALGPAAVEGDRFLRSTGMLAGAQRNLDRIRAAGGLEWDLLTWYAEGVNAYRDAHPAVVPLEMKILGTRPARWEPLHTLLLLQYMAYDLSWATDDPAHGPLRDRLGAAYDTLYPTVQPYAVPIVGAGAAAAERGRATRAGAGRATGAVLRGPAGAAPLARLRRGQDRLAGTLGEGFVRSLGKGSNNWGVAGARSATGAPILAGDMHLGLSLPAIWYEVHLVTPTMNTYGVTIPGAPLPVEAFNDHVAWAFTNTGADVIDHYRLALDPAGRRYRYDGAWRDLGVRVDTIRVLRGAPVLDTLRTSHLGPVTLAGGEAVAVRWTAHEPSRTLAALWGMNHARSYPDFEAALRLWDTPMQNVLYAGHDGVLAIRSTGYLPVRAGGTGAGLLDGTTSAAAWTGRVPFEALPFEKDPARGFLSSTNQIPAGAGYPYYLGHDWQEVFRSVRIRDLLAGKPRHTVDDLKRYQADVHAVQADWARPLLAGLGAPGAGPLAPRADTLRAMLLAWDGNATVDRAEPLVLWHLVAALRRLAWDEPAFDGAPRPADAQLLKLLAERPRMAVWDVAATPAREDAPALVARALAATADTLAARYGWTPDAWRWGDHHRIVFRHLTRAQAFGSFWRGPYPWPGFTATLSPGGALTTTHSASWRVVVDLSRTPPVGYGVYPGGQSGDPGSPHYADFLPAYLGFRHFPLYKPARADAFDPAKAAAHLTLRPR